MNSADLKRRAREAPGESVEQLRQQLGAALEREREIAQLLGSESPDAILHDLRNLLNEVQLLRIVTAELKEES